jgi:DNA-directed RNA polymerase subunit RPC12/RpoP
MGNKDMYNQLKCPMCSYEFDFYECGTACALADLHSAVPIVKCSHCSTPVQIKVTIDYKVVGIYKPATFKPKE